MLEEVVEPWTGEPSLTASPLADGFVNRRIRNRTYGGVGGRRGDPASYPLGVPRMG